MSYRTFFQLTAPLLLSACNLSIDPGLIRDGSLPDGSEPDAADHPDAVDDSDADVEPPDWDAGEPLDADVGEPDANGDTGGDLGNPDADITGCDGASCSAACEADEECAEENYCSLARGGECMPRCDDAAGCMELALEPRPLISDGKYVYWGGDTLMAWDLVHTPFVVSADVTYVEPLFVADDTVYVRDGQELRRVPVMAGATSERIAASFSKAWPTTTHVYWSAEHVGKRELWRLARSGGAAELVHSSEGVVYVGGDDDFVYHWEQRAGSNGSMLVEEDLATFSQRRDIYAAMYAAPSTARDGFHAERVGDILFVGETEFPSLPVRVDLMTLDYSHVHSLYADSSLQWMTVGNRWIYGGGIILTPDSTEFFSVHRAEQDDPSKAEELLHLPFAQGSAYFTVHGSLLVYVNDGHLFTKPISP
jgi:hypothetical protein